MKLTPDPRNPNRMSEEDKGRMKASLEEFGDLGVIVINRKGGKLIGGHQRADVLAAGKLVVVDCKKEPDGTVGRGHLEHGGKKYAVRVVDWTDKKAKAAMLAANRFARVGRDSKELLTALIDDLVKDSYSMDLTGYDEEAVKKLMSVDTNSSGASPEFSEERVTDSSVDAAKKKMDAGHAGAGAETVNVICPECAAEFEIEKPK